MSTVSSLKTVVRQELAKKLSSLSLEQKKRQSKSVFDKLVSLSSFQESKRVCTFLSTNSEIDTEPIVRGIFEDGKECFVPRCNKYEMEMVKLFSVEDWETLSLNKWGIKEPSLNDCRDNALETGGLDFVVVPGVAFTCEGKRLGHGGGYYDKFLVSLRQNQERPVLSVGIAFKEQILDDLPTDETDVKVDIVLCGD